MTTSHPEATQKQELIDAARARIPNVPVLINTVSKRVKQLIAGYRPYVRPLSATEDKDAIALREIAEGKLTLEIDFSAVVPKAEE